MDKVIGIAWVAFSVMFLIFAVESVIDSKFLHAFVEMAYVFAGIFLAHHKLNHE